MSIRDEMVRCPFDEHHRVSRARFPVHLIKCRKQHKGKNFSICPYNATHYVLTPEFQFHMENCPDRKEKDLAAPVPDDTYNPPKDEIIVPPPSETWDNEGENVVSYLDVKDSLISKLPVLRAPSGMTKSERKKFMRREIHRFHNLGKIDQPSTSMDPNADGNGSDAEQEFDDMDEARGVDEEPQADDEEEGQEDEEQFSVVKRKGTHERGNN